MHAPSPITNGHQVRFYLSSAGIDQVSQPLVCCIDHLTMFGLKEEPQVSQV
jgi:hypothetical protein